MIQTFPSMHKSIFLLIGVLFFYSCKKEDLPEPAKRSLDPAMPIILEEESLFSGQFWGINIGDPAEEVHASIQQIKVEKQIGSVGVTGNIFTSITDLETRIPLYHTLLLDESHGTSDGVQFYFAENKIKSIYLNSGESISQWPPHAAHHLSVETGDPINGIYKKLVAISKQPESGDKFERMLFFLKNLSTVYDSRMSVSPEWYFGSTVNNKKGYQVKLNFKSGKLFSIHYTLYEFR
jgi:hypothetical protein